MTTKNRRLGKIVRSWGRSKTITMVFCFATSVLKTPILQVRTDGWVVTPKAEMAETEFRWKKNCRKENTLQTSIVAENRWVTLVSNPTYRGYTPCRCVVWWTTSRSSRTWLQVGSTSKLTCFWQSATSEAIVIRLIFVWPKKAGPRVSMEVIVTICDPWIDPNFQQDIPVHCPAIGGDFVLLFAENLEKMNQIYLASIG